MRYENRGIMKKPSNFTKYPWNSALKTAESEIVAQNIMKILERTGNTWRELSWIEYKKERLKDGNFSDREKEYFKQVINYCINPDTAVLFSKEWT